MDQNRRHKHPLNSPRDESTLAYMEADANSYFNHTELSTSPRNGPMSAPTGRSIQLPDRPYPPTRSATTPSPRELDQKRPNMFESHNSRSEDMNHSSPDYPNDLQASERTLGKSQALLTASRSTSPSSSSNHNYPSSSGHSDSSRRRSRSGSNGSSSSGASGTTGLAAPPSSSHTTVSSSMGSS